MGGGVLFVWVFVVNSLSLCAVYANFGISSTFLGNGKIDPILGAGGRGRRAWAVNFLYLALLSLGVRGASFSPDTRNVLCRYVRRTMC